MRKLSVIAIAVVACLAIGSVTVAVAKTKTKKVATTVTASFTPGPLVPVDPANPYSPMRPGSGTFGGKVKSDSDNCKSNRSVSVTSPNGTTLGKDKSADNGKWDVQIVNTIIVAGDYEVEVAKRTITKKKKNGDKIKTVCKPAHKTVVVP